MLVSAALCPAPPLLHRPLTGLDPAVPALRAACAAAVGEMLAAGPDVVAVVGAAPRTGRVPAGLPPPFPALRGEPQPGPVLPLALALGCELLDGAGPRVRVLLQGVGPDEAPAGCAALGEELAAAAGAVGLLVMADGSARRSVRAPGHLDDRAAGFDAAVERAVRAGDLGALLAVDPALARDLLAAGRPAWQVLAGAAGGRRRTARVHHRDDPFGVEYLVASLA